MKLLTKKIIAALPSLYTKESVKLEDQIVICKFFTPDANWVWFVFEGEAIENGDYIFWGMVHGHVKEVGYFRLSELKKVHGPMGLAVERDLSVFKAPYKDLR